MRAWLLALGLLFPTFGFAPYLIVVSFPTTQHFFEETLPYTFFLPLCAPTGPLLLASLAYEKRRAAHQCVAAVSFVMLAAFTATHVEYIVRRLAGESVELKLLKVLEALIFGGAAVALLPSLRCGTQSVTAMLSRHWTIVRVQYMSLGGVLLAHLSMENIISACCADADTTARCTAVCSVARIRAGTSAADLSDPGTPGVVAFAAALILTSAALRPSVRKLYGLQATSNRGAAAPHIDCAQEETLSDQDGPLDGADPPDSATRDWKRERCESRTPCLSAEEYQQLAQWSTGSCTPLVR